MYTITTSIGDRTITVSAPSEREVLSLFAAINPPVGTITGKLSDVILKDVVGVPYHAGGVEAFPTTPA